MTGQRQPDRVTALTERTAAKTLPQIVAARASGMGIEVWDDLRDQSER